MKASSKNRGQAEIVDSIDDLDEAKDVIKMLLSYIQTGIPSNISFPYYVQNLERYMNGHENGSSDIDIDLK
jgi:hypothetical protein